MNQKAEFSAVFGRYSIYFSLWDSHSSNQTKPPKTHCKVVQVIILNVLNSKAKPLDQEFVELSGSFLTIYIDIPLKPYKGHATELLLH